MASEKVSVVMRGFLNLSINERNEFIEEINNYIKAEENKKKTLKEGFDKKACLSLGPLKQSGCPCCGK
jgi:hypothetical protein